MFYSECKRHTGGWCGPGQRLTPSAVCQPTAAGQVSGRLPAVLAPAPASVDQGPGASLLPIAYCLLPRKRVSRSTPPTQPKRNTFHCSIRAPFSSYPVHPPKSPLPSPGIGRRKGVRGMDEGRKQLATLLPCVTPVALRRSPLPRGRGVGGEAIRHPKTQSSPAETDGMSKNHRHSRLRCVRLVRPS